MPLPKKMPRKTQNSKSKQQEEEGRVYANRYKVIRRLGSGSFGTVFLVEDMKTPTKERKVLKEIYVGELQPDETVDAMREAKLLAKLNHPNIVKFMDSFIDREFFCIVTEYCEGGDLDDKIVAWRKAGKMFDESLLLAWFIQIVLAVQNMHEKRILHRDLKTRNIFLKNNMIKLGDFGISRILMGTSDMATTFTGTPYYMSPEVLKHEGYNHKSDIWSLGVVLYELCNLQHAFQGQSLMGVMYKIVEGELPKLNEKYSKELHTFYSKLLDKDPKLRPSAAEILKLEYIAQNMKKLKIQMNSKLSGSLRADENTHGSSIQRPQTRSGRHENKKLYEEPMKRPMTPMDRLKLRKQQKADEEAERIKQFMADQAPDTQAQYSIHKKKQNQVSLPWVDDHPDVFSDPTFTLTESNSWEFSPPTTPTLLYDPPQTSLDNGNTLTWGTNEGETLSLTMVSEIPEDADFAETFYSQFEDEFEEDSGAEASDEEDEFSALVGRMEDALDHSAIDIDRTLSDDVMGQALTSSMRQQRIDGLRTECIKLLGKDAFQRAYRYLKDARFGDDMQNEDSIIDGLGKIVSTPRDCFLVDQLLFMEKQAEIAAMT